VRAGEFFAQDDKEFLTAECESLTDSPVFAGVSSGEDWGQILSERNIGSTAAPRQHDQLRRHMLSVIRSATTFEVSAVH
jgi:hypothetical protein